MGKIAEIQRILGVDPDDKWGPLSQAALEAAAAAPQKWVPPHPSLVPEPAVDERSAKNIATLLPPVRVLAVKLLQTLHAVGIIAKIISGTRTYAEQDEIYEQGRSKPGTVVTNARGGYSNHNFGVAFDIGIFDEHGRYQDESPLYRKAGALGRHLGLIWGGDWNNIQDEPHFEWRPDWAKNYSEGGALAAYRDRHSQGTPIA